MDKQEQKIQKKIKELNDCQGNYKKINARLKRKRLRWIKENKDKLNLTSSLPRQAYEILFFQYMNLDPREVPVIYEDEKKIVWRSYNFCPVLEACKKLKLDTRIVCKKGLEESVQDFVGCIDSRLKFSRSYKKIRPYKEYCEESIELIG